jgi:hypothetical protein
MTDESGIDSRQYCSVQRSGLPLKLAQPRIHMVPGAHSAGCKGKEVSRWYPLSAEVKVVWTYTSTVPYVWMACCSTGQRGTIFVFFFFALPHLETFVDFQMFLLMYSAGCLSCRNTVLTAHGNGFVSSYILTLRSLETTDTSAVKMQQSTVEKHKTCVYTSDLYDVWKTVWR